MSKSSTASAPKNPTPLPAKSAWARGPPQSSSTAPSPGSQSPASSTPVLQSHSRRPSALGQGIPIKDGVSIPLNNLGAVKQGSAVAFGSIDDVSAPISSSLAAVPLTKSERVKTFRASVVPPTASTSTAPLSVLSATTPPVEPKIDITEMFQRPSSASSSNPPSHTSSLSMRNVGLSTQQYQQPPPTPPTPSISANRLDGGSRAFVPRPAAKLTIKKADGTEVSLENLTKSTTTPPATAVPSSRSVVHRQGSPETPNRRPTSIRMTEEKEDQYKSWLAELKQYDRLKAEAKDREKEKEKAEAERKAKITEAVRNLEIAARLEKEQKELPRKLKLKQEEERILKVEQEEEEKALRLSQEKVNEEKERKEKERLEQEQKELRRKQEEEMLRKVAEVLEHQRSKRELKLKQGAAAKANAEAMSELKPEEREEAETEAQKGDGKDGQLVDAMVVDFETSKSMKDGKDNDGHSMHQPTDIGVEKPIAEDPATIRRSRAIRLVQEREDGLTTDQKVAMVSCFMEDTVASDTYVLLTDPEVRQAWILMMLMKRPI